MEFRSSLPVEFHASLAVRSSSTLQLQSPESEDPPSKWKGVVTKVRNAFHTSKVKVAPIEQVSPEIRVLSRRLSASSPDQPPELFQNLTTMVETAQRRRRASSFFIPWRQPHSKDPIHPDPECKDVRELPPSPTLELALKDPDALLPVIEKMRGTKRDSYFKIMDPAFHHYFEALQKAIDPNLKPLESAEVISEAQDKLILSILQFFHQGNDESSDLSRTRQRTLEDIFLLLPCPMVAKCQMATPMVYRALLKESVGRDYLKEYHLKAHDLNEFHGFILLTLFEKSVDKSLTGSEIKEIQEICRQIQSNSKVELTPPLKETLQALLDDDTPSPTAMTVLLNGLFLGTSLPLGFNKGPGPLDDCSKTLSILNSDDAEKWDRARTTLNDFLIQHIYDTTHSMMQQMGNLDHPGPLSETYDDLSLNDRILILELCKIADMTT